MKKGGEIEKARQQKRERDKTKRWPLLRLGSFLGVCALLLSFSPFSLSPSISVFIVSGPVYLSVFVEPAVFLYYSGQLRGLLNSNAQQKTPSSVSPFSFSIPLQPSQVNAHAWVAGLKAGLVKIVSNNVVGNGGGEVPKCFRQCDKLFTRHEWRWDACAARCRPPTRHGRRWSFALAQSCLCNPRCSCCRIRLGGRALLAHCQASRQAEPCQTRAERRRSESRGREGRDTIASQYISRCCLSQRER